MATQRSSDVAWEGLIYYKQKATFMSVSEESGQPGASRGMGWFDVAYINAHSSRVKNEFVGKKVQVAARYVLITRPLWR